MLQSKDRRGNSTIEKQLRDVKVEYSESLKEVNLILQKYKKLEEIHREALNNIDQLKE